MNNLYIIIDQFTNDYNPLFLEILPALAILCAISAIVNKNPVVSVLFLIGLFINIACLLALIGLNFLGLSYLLVYVGAISILFLFILMLMSIRSSDLELNSINNILPLSALVSLILGITIYKKIYISSIQSMNFSVNDDSILSNKPLENSGTFTAETVNLNDVLYISNLTWDKHLIEFSHITSIGNILYTNYSIWLILASLILLLAMIGGIIITIKPSHSN